LGAEGGISGARGRFWGLRGIKEEGEKDKG
jgi:hypothetical protein